ncbi:hypothetical protein Golob_007425 [Gossypium lobatum]|uniref:Uncharacterized protein n=1 Tax=Gossypium lobatum TaxID=34289 RepID=A0A7J8MCB0_9ROSI|nr:hypothetical protein [Gossypium lobatum]
MLIKNLQCAKTKNWKTIEAFILQYGFELAPK